MKWHLLVTIGLLLVCALPTRAQIGFNWNELFKQKKTEIKYLGQHVANLQLYLHYVKEGYKIVQQGNHLIQQAKNGELNLHDIFYLSLKVVNQQIRKYPAVAKTIDHHQYVAKTSAALLQKVRANELMKETDEGFVATTVGKLRTDMAASLDELIKVISSGNYDLRDDERLRKIDELEAYARKRVVFIKYYYGYVVGAAGQRSRERAALTGIEALHRQ